MPGADVTSLMSSQTTSAQPAAPDLLQQIGTIARSAGSTVTGAVKDAWDGLLATHGDPVQAIGNAVVGQGQASFDQLKEAVDQARRGNYFNTTTSLIGAIPGFGPPTAAGMQTAARGDVEGTDRAIGQVLGVGGLTAAPDIPGAIADTAKAITLPKPPGGMPAFTADILRAVPPTRSTPYTVADLNAAAPFLAEQHALNPVDAVTGVRDAANAGSLAIDARVAAAVNQFGTDLIRTDPLAAARAALSRGDRSTDVQVGMAALADLGLDGPITLTKAKSVLTRINAEQSTAQANANQWDRSAMLKSDPAFLARDIVAQQLRQGMFDQLQARGVDGIADLRSAQASLMRIRDAAANQQFNGGRTVSGTGANGIVASAIRYGLPTAGGVIGEQFGGPYIGLPAGVSVGVAAARKLVPANLTKDALATRAFERLGLQAPPAYPVLPPTQAPAGLLPAPPIQLAPAPDTSSITVNPATFGQIGRDPATGQFKRVYSGGGF